jgi:Na+/H+-dicarboxylate symporter
MQLYTKILIGMIVGAVLGLLVGPTSSILPASGVELISDVDVYSDMSKGEKILLAQGIRRMKILDEKPGQGPNASAWLKVGWKLRSADILKLKAQGIKQVEGHQAGDKIEGWLQEIHPQVQRYAPLGLTFVNGTEWIGRLFLALIKMVVIPLVFFSLVVGVASLGDFRKLGRIGGRTILFFMLTTTFALVIGVTLANVVRPGHMCSEADRAVLLSSYQHEAVSTVEKAAESPSLADQLLSIVPENPVKSMADGDMLQIIFFAMMLGMALTFMKTKRSKLVVDVADRLNEAMVMLVHIIMKLAPYGVAALLFKVVGTTGLSVLLALGVYALVVLVGLGLHLFITYGAVVRWGAKLSLIQFLKSIRPAMLLGFSTSSSSATLPVTMECAEENLGVSSEVSSFVLPLGATINMDGTALYQGVAAIFIAQIYGMDLGLAEQATIVVSATLASVGAAGVPGAGMITLAMVLTAVGVPTEGLALILGVDRLLDMFRSATNIVGDSTATVFMARLEGETMHLLSKEEDEADPKHGFEHRLDEGPHPVPRDEEEE